MTAVCNIGSNSDNKKGKKMSVHKKLMQARIALQGKKLAKSGHNKFAGYQYFELGDFLPTVQQIFSEIGLCGAVSFSADIASLTIFETDGEGFITFTSPMGSAALKGCHEVQNIGAVETYQRRYLWVTAMEIVEHDALDAVTGVDNEGSKVTPIKKTQGKYSLALSQLNKAAEKGYKSFAAAWGKLDKATHDGLIAEHETELKQIKESSQAQDAEIATQA